MKKILQVGYNQVYEGFDAFVRQSKTNKDKINTTGGVVALTFPSAIDAKAKVDQALTARDICVRTIDSVEDIHNTDYILLSGASEGWISWWRYIRKCGKLNRTIYLATESDAINPYNGREKLTNLVSRCFPSVLSWHDAWIGNNVVQMKLACSNFSYQGSLIPFEQKKLLTMIIRNRKKTNQELEMTRERIHAIHYFDDKPGLFDLYGKGWGKEQKNYCGIVQNKCEAYSKYKFAICFENSRTEGYISEKIFDCFVSGIVPIYAGARNVKEYIPENCFIDYFEYSNWDELVNMISEIDETKYEQYLQNIQRFLDSDAIKIFSTDAYAEKVQEVIGKLPAKFNVNWKIQVRCQLLYLKIKFEGRLKHIRNMCDRYWIKTKRLIKRLIIEINK